MKRLLTLFLIVAGATISYLLGFATGAGILIAIGVVLEVWFWVKALRIVK